MALSEGLKGFVDFFTKSFSDNVNGDDAFTSYYDSDDGYTGESIDGNAAIETLYSTRPSVKAERIPFERESKVAIHPNNYKSGEIMVVEPRSFSESAQIVKKLLDSKTVVLHLDLLDREQAQRTIDFVCGATHAMSGTAQKVTDSVVIFTPSSVSLSVENGAIQNKFTEALWNKPL
ncbi:MAG: cell division protein SepF [bacterium]|nr:cell division protein SepF [bacterium]